MLENVGLIFASVVIGIAVAVLLVGRRGPAVIELSRREAWLQELLAQSGNRPTLKQQG